MNSYRIFVEFDAATTRPCYCNINQTVLFWIVAEIALLFLYFREGKIPSESNRAICPLFERWLHPETDPYAQGWALMPPLKFEKKFSNI